MPHRPSCLAAVRSLCSPLLTLALLGLVGRSQEPATHAGEARKAEMTTSASEQRLFTAVRHLASDELEGRGVGTSGLDRAADYIAQQFTDAGLDTKLIDGGPFQKFKMTVGASLGPTNQVVFRGPKASPTQTTDLKLGKDFNPLAIGGSGKLDAPLVFAGYGITDKDNHYDDYAGIDVKGKAVIVLRHEPQQANPHSVFNGTNHSLHAPYSRKLSNAFEHGAAAVIFCTDDFEIEKRVADRRVRWQKAIDELTESQAKFKELKKPTLEQTEAQRKKVDVLLAQIRDQGRKLAEEYDPLIGFMGAGSGEGSRIPALHCRRDVLDKLLHAAGAQDLATLEREIDQGPNSLFENRTQKGGQAHFAPKAPQNEPVPGGSRGPKPHSFELAGWRLTGEINISRREAEVKNVIGVLPGEGPHASETIIIGAHYDHLGWGGEGSFVPEKREIHNGADDNASGTSVLIEVARRLAGREKKLPRRVVFIAFTGEERGLVGSAYYCKHPLFPLDSTVAMFNMDMVGRLEADKLIVQGTDTASEFVKLVDEANERAGFKLTRQPGGFGPSDHSSFYSKKIPVLHFFTGVHRDYHRPTDDFDKLSVPGMRRVAELVGDVTVEVADLSDRPHYQESKAPVKMGSGGDRPYFGSIPDFSQAEPGYALSGVAHGSPADKAGLKPGDIIIKLGDSQIGNLEDFDSALRKHKAGDKVPVVVRRSGKELTLPVTLDPPR